MKNFMLSVFTMIGLHATTVQAVEFNKVSEKSSIAFVYKQMNVPTEGNFKRFTSALSFDPAKPEAGKARLDIDLASIDTGSLDADEEVLGKLWFNTKAFPQGQFVSTSIKQVSPGRLEVRGKLTLKGKTADVVTPVSYRIDGQQVTFDGVVTIKRMDFAIGEGIWSDFGTVANDVQIKFKIVASAAAVLK